MTSPDKTNQQESSIPSTTTEQEPILDAVRKATIESLNAKGSQQALHNFDLRDSDDSFAMMMMECADCANIWDLCPCDLAIQYIHVREGEQFNRSTGEIESKLRTTMIDIEGNVVATNSPVASRVAMALLSSNLGSRKFDPPLTIKAEKKPTGSGGQCLKLSVDLESLRELQVKHANEQKTNRGS